jgi:putative redox protein
MSEIEVRHDDGDRFRVRVRGHEIVVDQPVSDGGGDSGPTPTELFVAGLASCVAFYGGRFLRRHDIPADGFGVRCRFEFASDRPARVGAIALDVTLPRGFPAARRAAFRSVIEHCTVHNSITQAPTIGIAIVESRAAA